MFDEPKEDVIHTIKDFDIHMKLVEKELDELRKEYTEKKDYFVAWLKGDNKDFIKGKEIADIVDSVIIKCYGVLLEKCDKKKLADSIPKRYSHDKIVELRKRYPDSMVNDFSPLEYELLSRPKIL